MKRIVLAAVAASLLALPTVQAQAAPLNSPSLSANLVQVDWKKGNGRVVKKKTVVRRNGVVRKKVVVRKPHWRHGQRYAGWRHHRAVDYHRHGLRRPGRGQEWIRVGNDYLLVSIASGIIAALISAN